MGESIVVGTDGSATANVAVKEAIRIAKALDADLHVVSAYEPLKRAQVRGGTEDGWQPLSDAHVDATLSDAETAVRMRGVEVTTHAVRHGPAEAILEVADKVKAAMIIVGSRGMHGHQRLTLGNVPNQISHKARCNVLIVNTGRRTNGAAG